MKALVGLVAVVAIGLIGWLGSAQPLVFGVVLPAAAVLIFLVGVVHRVIVWGRSPVPFRITSVGGQQASLPWLARSPLDSPKNGFEAALRVAMDVLFFRTLFGNTRVRRGASRRPVYVSERLLWAAALTFHWSLLIVVVRHLRYVLEPTPAVLAVVERWDGFFQVTTPALLASDVLLVCAGGFLLGRRLVDRQVRYLSLPADYFPLLLILGIALSGLFMRHVGRVDLVAVKELSLGLVTLRPRVPVGLTAGVFVHLALVSALLAYAPFSKLLHMAGIFLSPTRNLANDSRRRRHVNPWNPVVAPHTYPQWEAEFRDKIVAAGLPLDEAQP